jgi:hypothetical protein
MHRLIVEDGFASTMGRSGAQSLSRRRPCRILWFPAESVRGANPPDGMLLILIRRATSDARGLGMKRKRHGDRPGMTCRASSRAVPIKKILGAA